MLTNQLIDAWEGYDHQGNYGNTTEMDKLIKLLKEGEYIVAPRALLDLMVRDFKHIDQGFSNSAAGDFLNHMEELKGLLVATDIALTPKPRPRCLMNSEIEEILKSGGKITTGTDLIQLKEGKLIWTDGATKQVYEHGLMALSGLLGYYKINYYEVKEK